MKYDVSVLIPGIRPEFWLKVYESMEKSLTTKTWEIVFAGPVFPDSMSGKPNVKYIHTYASPIVARQMALLQAEGDWICHSADDCTFIPGAFDKTFELLAALNGDYKTIIAGKYLENVDASDPALQDNVQMRGDQYYSLAFHGILKNITPLPKGDYYLINTGIISRQLMFEVGGYDCQFEACAMACVDLSLRLQLYGANVVLQPDPLFTSTHLPGLMGDHGPINDGQIQHDEPLFYEIWKQPESAKRCVISLDTWRDCPTRWERRFGKA